MGPYQLAEIGWSGCGPHLVSQYSQFIGDPLPHRKPVYRVKDKLARGKCLQVPSLPITLFIYLFIFIYLFLQSPKISLETFVTNIYYLDHRYGRQGDVCLSVGLLAIYK